VEVALQGTGATRYSDRRAGVSLKAGAAVAWCFGAHPAVTGQANSCPDGGLARLDWRAGLARDLSPAVRAGCREVFAPVYIVAK
jgi:hypothetical protein